jgi:hypothetical protein
VTSAADDEEANRPALTTDAASTSASTRVSTSGWRSNPQAAEAKLRREVVSPGKKQKNARRFSTPFCRSSSLSPCLHHLDSHLWILPVRYRVHARAPPFLADSATTKTG